MENLRALHSGLSPRRAVLYALFSFLGVYGLTWALPTGGNALLVGNSVLALALGAGLWLLFAVCLRRWDRRSLLCSGVLGAALACFQVAGCQISQYDALSLSRPGLYVGVLGMAVLFAAVLNGIFTRPAPPPASAGAPSRWGFLFAPSAKRWLALWALLFACWVPCLLAVFPGIYAYDGPTQVAQWLSNHVMIAQHPPLHTLFISMCFDLGRRVFGSNEAGMAVYSILQMLGLSAALAFLCHTLARRGAPRPVQAGAVLFFALFPMVPVMAVSSTKDILFCAVLVVAVCCVWDMAADSAGFFGSVFQQARFAGALCLLVALRNNTVYFLALSLPFFFGLCKGHRVHAAALCAAGIAFSFILTGPVYQAAGVIPGDFREAMSVPAQQLARTVRDHGAALTAQERASIARFIPEEALAAYVPRIADPVKNHFQTKYFQNHKREFAKTYLGLLAKYPGTFAEAFLCNSLGFWYPDTAYQSHSIWQPTIYVEYFNKEHMDADRLPIVRRPLLPGLAPLYEGVALRQAANRVPGLSVCMGGGFAAWGMLAAAALCICRRQYRLLLPLAMLAAFWITLLLSPAVLYRYAFPLICCLPVALSILFGRGQGTPCAKTPRHT